MNKEILKKVKALYVEDEENVRVFTSKTLESVVFSIDTAANGKEGLEKFTAAFESDNPYNLIITDINMPKMDGLVMSKEIKQIDPNICIIVTSAHNDADFLKKSIDIGINSYTLKPIDLYQLIEEIIKTMEPYFLKQSLQSAQKELLEENLNLANVLEKNKAKIKTLLEVQDTIIIVTNGRKLEDSNTKFLDFFDVRSVDEFVDMHGCVCNLFVDEDGKRSSEIDLESTKNWIEQLVDLSNDHCVVGLKDTKNEIKFFEISISKYDLDGLHYVVSFSDVTQLKAKSKLYEYQNTHDVTTGLYNESKIKKYITSEIKRSDRYKHDLSLIIFDFMDQDISKENHIKFAELLKVNTRDQDFAARIHINQFVLLLPESNINAANVVQDKILKEFEAQNSNHIKIQCACDQYIKGETQEVLFQKVLEKFTA